ncbi:MAG: hypothetical protein AVDCRST_MAG33-1808, partial [uncultured Thermomicrobiales bacterium]
VRADSVRDSGIIAERAGHVDRSWLVALHGPEKHRRLTRRRGVGV